ncbi:MAG: ParB/RepB/Spo0J family partition protein [Pseudomonadales bacterium]|nr:ParB/RepB/Spo0J family partition protein [Pseudomonadales bacterium]
MIRSIPLNQLTISAENVRVVRPNKKADKQLIASIASNGLLNNLVVVRSEGAQFEVVAGGRRLAALEWLVQSGDIDSDYLVDCRVKEPEEAVEISLAENFAREPMHPADEFEAYKRLADQGKNEADIAKAFGVSKNQVKKMLRLGCVHSKLVALYRKGKLDMSDVMAFAVTEDQERQWSCYEALKNGWFGPYQIRQFLTDDTVTSDDPWAKFVGMKAYKANGGRTEKDLFESAVYWVDVALVRQLGNEKLEALKVACEAEGWSWVEVSEAAHRLRNQCRELSAPFDAVPDELMARIQKAEQALSELQNKDYEDMVDEDFDREGALEESLDQMEEEKECFRAFTDEQKAIAGCVIGLSGGGEPMIFRGLVKREDEAKAACVLKQHDATVENDPALFAQSEPIESQALRHDLEVYYRQAFQAQLMSHEDVCTDILTYTLVCGVIGVSGYDERLMGVSLNMPNEEALNIEETQAAAAIQEKRESLDLAWLEKEEQADRFDGFMALSRTAKKRLLAYCAARLCSSPLKGQPTSAWSAIVTMSGFELRQLWQPTASTYFNRIKRDALLNIGDQVIGDEWRIQNAKKKKGDLAAMLPQHEAMHGWIPDYLQ